MQDQPLASQRSFYDTDDSQGCNTAGRSRLNHEEESAWATQKNDFIASQDQHQHLGNFEASEIEFDPALLQQSPSPIVSQTETEPGVTTQEVSNLGAIIPDQICTCATCLNGYRCPPHLRWPNVYPDYLKSRNFGCCVPGCEVTTRDFKEGSCSSKLVWLFRHEGKRSHYGKPGSYRCREINCKFVTKRWSDFKRHSSSIHCIKPKDLGCPDPSCKYHQIDFSRKDKLKSHCEKVHGGMFQPAKPNQAIAPKAVG